MTEKRKPGESPVLVAIDFSPHSERALVWAARTAECLGAPLLALHVIHDPESAPGYYFRRKQRKKVLERAETAAAEMMEEFVEALRKEHPGLRELKRVKTRLVTGLPVTRILEVARKSGANMIVVGSQGRTGISELLLGSKALKVAQLASVPVTIVKAEKTRKSKGKKPKA